MKAAPRPVLLLQGSVKLGGAKQSLLTMAEILREGDYQPVIGCSGEGWFTDELQQRGFPFVVLPFYAWRKWLQRWRVAPAIRTRWQSLLGKWQFALAHSNEFWWAPQARLFGLVRGIPALVHLRDGHHTLKKAKQYQLSQMDRVVAVSSALREQFVSDRGLYEKTVVIFNGHDEAKLAFAAGTAEARAKFGIRPGELVIGNAGKICDRKNQLLLARAVAELKNQHRLAGFKIVFAGDADLEYAEALRGEVSRLGLLDETVFLGAITDMAAFYAAIDLLVHCARREGLPRVLPEAMLARRPVIATAAEGVEDAIPDSRFGTVVPDDQSPSLASAIENFFCHREAFEPVIENAHQRTRALFSLEAHRRKLLALYRELDRGMNPN